MNNLMQSMYKTEIVEIYYSEDKKLIIQRWSSTYPKFTEFKNAIDKTVELFKDYNAERLISDTSIQKVAGADSTQCAVDSIPVLKEYGMKKMAFILPEDIYFRKIVYNFIFNSQDSCVQAFNNEDEAIVWLFE